MLSIPHMIVVFIIVLVVFGPNKLPELARGLGKLMAEFRKASADFKGAFEQEMREIERQTMLAERKKAAEAAAAAAAAAPVQPATLATPAGAQTEGGSAADGEVGGATEASVTEPAANSSSAPELVATPVAEAVARGSEVGKPETELDGSTPSGGSPQEIQNSAQHNSAQPDPAHDSQQPA
jgi:sec-independent protein translocase protein TatB